MSPNPESSVLSLSKGRIANPGRIAFIGGGNMARSLVGALVGAGVPASTIAVAEPNADLRDALATDFGIAVHATNADAAQTADCVVLAVKPQVLEAVCTELAPIVEKTRPLVVSIAAGMRIAKLERWLGAGLAIVRAMPNTPALIGAGATGLHANARVDASQRSRVQALFDAAGASVWIDDEALMDTVTALSGSGPAYFFLLAEAFEDAAVAQGLPRDAARTLVTHTCLGAGRMLVEGGEPPATLRERVTSPGGTTAAALEAFAAGGLRGLAARALAAATRRGVELSGTDD
jgi:pyrroline-5-carboxylate reductase